MHTQNQLSGNTDHSTSRTDPLAYWLALLHAPGVGPITFCKLLEHYKNPKALFEFAGKPLDGLDKLPHGLASYIKNPNWPAVDKDLEWLSHNGNHLVTLFDSEYPLLLKEIHDPPPLLFVQGNVSLLSSMQLAIVGSRNPSPTGQETSHAFARQLSCSGLNITSGLALGIDVASHRGALSANGNTIAVMGSGLDRIYPKKHQALAQQIADCGALVSEFPIGTAPLRENFPRRNRIISGLCLGTLVIEAALKSGSLITARMALEQGREVFAIPGSIHNPMSRGCHALIRQGAKLVETTQDILEELGSLALASLNTAVPSFETKNIGPKLDTSHTKVLNSLDFDPVSIDKLVERTGLTADAVSSILLVLELQNHVRSIPGGMYLCINKRA